MSLNLQRNLSFDYLPLNRKSVTFLLGPGMCEDKGGVSGVAVKGCNYIVACSDVADELLLYGVNSGAAVRRQSHSMSQAVIVVKDYSDIINQTKAAQ